MEEEYPNWTKFQMSAEGTPKKAEFARERLEFGINGDGF